MFLPWCLSEFRRIDVTGQISNWESNVDFGFLLCQGGCGPRPSLLQSARTACAQKCGKQFRPDEWWPLVALLDRCFMIFYEDIYYILEDGPPKTPGDTKKCQVQSTFLVPTLVCHHPSNLWTKISQVIPRFCRRRSWYPAGFAWWRHGAMMCHGRHGCLDRRSDSWNVMQTVGSTLW